MHRDLKPRNVLLDGPDATLAKLCDFGLARITDETLYTANPEVGTAPCECDSIISIVYVVQRGLLRRVSCTRPPHH